MSETRIYRESLLTALEGTSRVAIVGSCTPFDAGEALIRERCPDVILLQEALPEGVVAARSLSRTGHNVVAFGVNEDEREVLAWAEAGVRGCVTRDASLDDFVSVIELAARGVPSCSPTLAGLLFRRVAASVVSGRFSETTPGPDLTQREIQILELLAQRLSNKQIATALTLQLPTVKNHVHHILQKLGVRRRADAVQWARFYDAPPPVGP